MSIQFLHPEHAVWLLALAAAVLAGLVYAAYRARARGRAGHPRFASLSRRSGAGYETTVLLLSSAAIALLVAAIAQPRVLRERRAPEYERQDLVVIMDRSVSMRARDVQPSRAARALTELKNFLRDRPDVVDRIGLVGFAETPLVISYLTRDVDSLLFYLDWMEEDPTVFYGTDIGAALTSGLEVVARDESPNRKVFLVISDGDDQGATLARALSRVVDAGIRVHTIGIGSPAESTIPVTLPGEADTLLRDDDGRLVTTRFDETTLRSVAAASGGRYVRSVTGGELLDALHAMARAERRQTGWQTTTEFRDVYPSLLAAAGVAAALLLAIL